MDEYKQALGELRAAQAQSIEARIEEISGYRPASDEEIVHHAAWIMSADDPWAELTLWLKERCAISQNRGDNEDTFLVAIVERALRFSQPVRSGDQK